MPEWTPVECAPAESIELATEGGDILVTEREEHQLRLERQHGLWEEVFKTE